MVEPFPRDYYKGIVGYIDHVVLASIDAILVTASCLFIPSLLFLSRDTRHAGVSLSIEIAEEDFDFIKTEFS